MDQTKAQDAYRIMAQGPVVVFRWSSGPGWPVELISGNIDQLLGYSEEDFLTAKIDYAQLIHPDDIERVKEEVLAASDKNEFKHRPYRLFDKNKNIHWITDQTKNIRNDQGEITHFEGIIVDITEYINTQVKLTHMIELEKIVSKISEQFLNTDFNADRLINATLKKIGNWAHIDRCRLFLISDGLMNNTHEWHHPKVDTRKNISQGYPIGVFPWWEKEMHKRGSILIDNTSELPDEAIAVRTVFIEQGIKSISAAPLFFANNPIGFFGCDMSRSYHRWTQEEDIMLRRVAELLGNIIQRSYIEQERVQMQQQLLLSSKLASVGELASGVAHEINNPLTVILCNLKKEQKNNQTPSIEKSINAAQRIKEIIKELKSFATSSPSSRISSDIHQLVTKTVSLVKDIYTSRGIDITVNLAASSSTIPINPNRFQQALMNILSNAHDAIEGKSGKITIQSYNNKNSFCLDVSDNGKGMTDQEIEQIFESFYTTKNDPSRVGLGLSLSRTIIQEFKGTLQANSEPGQGSTFKITLPLSKKERSIGETNQ